MYFLTKEEIDSLSSPGNSSNASSSACDFVENTFAVQICKFVVLAIILLVGLAGNALIVTIVYKEKELKKTVNFFIVNMAISDFVSSLISIPFSLIAIVSSSRQWPISETPGLMICKLKWYIQTVSFAVSAQSLVWIGLDRFVAVVLPLRVNLISSKIHAFAIASTWIVAVIINANDLVTNDLVKIDDEIICTSALNSTLLTRFLVGVRVAFLVAAPLILITVSYSLIAVTLRRQDKALSPFTMHQNQRKQQAVKMSFSIMAAFYICNLPMPLLLLLWGLGIPLSCSLYRELYFWCYVLMALSLTTNPIICFILVQSYRRGLMDLFRLKKAQGLPKTDGERTRQSNNSTTD